MGIYYSALPHAAAHSQNAVIVVFVFSVRQFGL